MNTNQTTVRPEDDAYNIQRGRSTSRASANEPRSASPSPMDDSSPPSEIDYAERVAANSNMDIEITYTPPPLVNDTTNFTFSLPPSNPHASLEEAPNSVPSGGLDISTEPSPPSVIPYSANVPADPSLWDGKFAAASLFGTNEFLASDINNITCSLQHMARFLRQRKLEGRNANNIRQLDPFGESAWDFVSAIFKSGWDALTTSNKSSIRSNISKEFSKSQHGIQIKKVPPPIPPIPPRPSKKILEKAKTFQRNFMAKDNYTVSSASNVLKIKEAFPALPNKKILEIHNAAFHQPTNESPTHHQRTLQKTSHYSSSL